MTGARRSSTTGRPTDILVLNGGSSSGTSTIARALQEILPGTWLTFGVDAFIEALPDHGRSSRADITFHPDGGVEPGPVFRAHEHAWRLGLAATARAGAPLVLDEVFLRGGAGQEQWRAVLDGLEVLWVGVHCDADVAAAREAQRPDRVPGMARGQATTVHAGVDYDVEVDTTHTSTADCVRTIAAHVVTASG